MLENRLSIMESASVPSSECRTTFTKGSKNRMCKIWTAAIITLVVLVSFIYAGVKINSSPSEDAVSKPNPIKEDLKKSIPDFKDKFQEAGNLTIMINKGMNTSIVENTSSTEHPEVNKWPKVFVMSSDPSYPVVCYSGVSLSGVNETENNTRVIPHQETGAAESERPTKIFVLSNDPVFPVICREGHIPANLTDNAVAGDGTFDDNPTNNVTCIRRDYENDISALFLHQTGPLQTAFNIFNSSISYGYFTVENVEHIGSIKLLNETIVDCGDYYFVIDNKAMISGGAAASLLAG